MINFSSSQQAILPSICQGRLTLTSGVPITTSDVTAATTVYFTPFRANAVSLYDGANWNAHAFSERSISVPASTNTNYDIFIYDNAGTLALETTAWTNDTTRATSIATQDGICVKSGATTRRYLGTIRTTGVSGQCEDSKSKRFVWNYCNRVRRGMLAVDATGSWGWTTTAWQQARNSSSNQVAFVVGFSEDMVVSKLHGSLSSATVAAYGFIGIGLDSTTPHSESRQGWLQVPVANHHPSGTSSWIGFPGIGYHYLTWCEYGGSGISFEGKGGFGFQNGLDATIQG